MNPVPTWSLVVVVAIVALTLLLIIGRRTASIMIRGADGPRWGSTLRTAERLAVGLFPYLLAFVIFAVTARWALNAVAAGYADKLFTLALVLARGASPPGPQPPAPPPAPTIVP